MDTRTFALAGLVVIAATVLGALGVLNGETVAALLGGALPTGAIGRRRLDAEPL